MNYFMKYESKDVKLFANEKVKMVIRKHWAVGLMIIIELCILVLFLPIILYSLFFYFYGFQITDVLLLSIIFTLVYILTIFLLKVIKWSNVMYDMIFITNVRIVDITQVDFFHRNIIETKLENVQDSSGEVKGFFNTLFDLGDLRIRTANDSSNFFINAVQSPNVCSREIFRLADLAKKNDSEKVNNESLKNKKKKFIEKNTKVDRIKKKKIKRNKKKFVFQNETISKINKLFSK
jgi:uncharacterized membrane protein YdbT with pleckstrin-like domain